MLLDNQINTVIVGKDNEEFISRAFEEDASKVPVMIMQGNLSNGFEYTDLNLLI